MSDQSERKIEPSQENFETAPEMADVAETAAEAAPEFEPGTDPNPAATAELESADREEELARQELYGGYPVPRSREEADRDAAASPRAAGWLDYWLPRLQAEPEGLPAEVSALLQQESFKPAELNILQGYVIGRRDAVSHWVAKRRVMDRLHEELRRIDRGEDVEREEHRHLRTVRYDQRKGTLFVERPGDGKRFRVTDGDIAADRVWGLTYRADESVPPQLWRRTRKLSAIRSARLEIEDLYNQEIADAENLDMMPTSSWSPEFLEEHPKTGVIAERLAQTLLTRLQFNRPELGLKIESSNVLEDMDLKYDFKVSVSDHRRGIAVEGPPKEPREKYVADKRRLGIQFTVNMDKIRHKERQLVQARRDKDEAWAQRLARRPVDDIRLVALPLDEARDAFRNWLAEDRPPGGPERYLPREKRALIVSAIIGDRLGLSREQAGQLLETPPPKRKAKR